MIAFRRQLQTSGVMPTLQHALMRAHYVQQLGVDVAPDPEPARLHEFAAAAELALGYLDGATRETARSLVQQHLERFFAAPECEDVAVLALQLEDIYVHHLRCLPGRTQAEWDSVGLNPEDGR